MVDLLSSSGHIGPDKGWCDRQDRLTVIETNASTAALLFDRGLGKPVKGVAPWKGVGKHFGKLLVEFIESSFGVDAIAEQVVILGFGQR